MTERKGVACWLAAFLACLAAGACSSSGAGPGADGGGESGSVDCTKDPLVDPTLAASLPITKPGKSGVLSFRIVQGSPYYPPSEGANLLTIQVLDGSGKALTDAMVSFPPTLSPGKGLNPWMPRMKHGSVEATATNKGDGTYTISMYASMVGVWQLVVQAESGGTPSDGGEGGTLASSDGGDEGGGPPGDAAGTAAPGSLTDTVTLTFCVQ
jgi:hypothetical protein